MNPENYREIKKTIDVDKTPLIYGETQQLIFEIWFRVLIRLPKLRSYKVPFRITWMSCGCNRSRGFETDPNNTWRIIRKKDKFYHKECGKNLNY